MFVSETGSAITSTCVGLGTDLGPPRGVAGRAVPGWNGMGSSCFKKHINKSLNYLYIYIYIYIDRYIIYIYIYVCVFGHFHVETF